MKRIILATIAVLSVSNIHAWEFERNPDRFISLGFNASIMRLDGSQASVDVPGMPFERIQLGEEEMSVDSVGLDLRIPLHQSVTMNLGAEQIGYNQDYVREGGIFTENSKLDGYRYSVGFRLYFNK